MRGQIISNDHMAGNCPSMSGLFGKAAPWQRKPLKKTRVDTRDNAGIGKHAEKHRGHQKNLARRHER
jgi:hypothetical protein